MLKILLGNEEFEIRDLLKKIGRCNSWSSPITDDFNCSQALTEVASVLGIDTDDYEDLSDLQAEIEDEIERPGDFIVFEKKDGAIIGHGSMDLTDKEVVDLLGKLTRLLNKNPNRSITYVESMSTATCEAFQALKAEIEEPVYIGMLNRAGEYFCGVDVSMEHEDFKKFMDLSLQLFKQENNPEGKKGFVALIKEGDKLGACVGGDISEEDKKVLTDMVKDLGGTLKLPEELGDEFTGEYNGVDKEVILEAFKPMELTPLYVAFYDTNGLDAICYNKSLDDVKQSFDDTFEVSLLMAFIRTYLEEAVCREN